NGVNTYVGPTTIQINSNNPTVSLGSNSPFGTGPVSLNLTSGFNAPLFAATGGTRTVGNTLNLNSGITFSGSASLAFNGSETIINAPGGQRFLNNNLTAVGKTITFGASPSSSTVTLGNPIANGGDGIGKALIFVPSAGAKTTINDVMQDPAAGGGAS